MKINRDTLIWILQFLFCQFGPSEPEPEPQLENSVKLIFDPSGNMKFAVIQRRMAVIIEAHTKMIQIPNKLSFLLAMADIPKIIGCYETSPLNELQVYTSGGGDLIIDNGPITTHYEESTGAWIDDGYPLLEPFFDPKRAVISELFSSSPVPEGVIDIKIGIMK